MTRDELEFAISRYLDGTLPAEERASLEAQMASDPQAQAMLEQERSLTAAIRASSPLPAIEWDQLALQISQAVDEQAEARMRKVSWSLRFGPSAFLALAASVLLAVGIGVLLVVGPRTSPSSTPHNPVAPQTALLVQGPEEEKPAGPSGIDVSIGPGGSYAKAPSLAPYADEIDSRPAH